MEHKIKLHDKTFRPFIPNQEIEAAIDAVAARLNTDYASTTDQDPAILLCTLNGAVVFAGELLKRLTFPLELTVCKLSSYEGTKTSGHVVTTIPIPEKVKGRRVIIVEDIVDTGTTIEVLTQMLKESGARDARICTLLTKPGIYKKNIPLDYVAMSIEPLFIVGFGLDYNELGRNLKDIYVLDE